MSELNIPDTWAEVEIGDITSRVKNMKPDENFDYVDIDS